MRSRKSRRILAVTGIIAALLSGCLPVPPALPGGAATAEAAQGTGRAAASSGPAFTVFTDTAKHWSRDYADALLQAGIVSVPQDGKFRPDEPVTRLDFAVWVAKAMELDAAGSGAPGGGDPAAAALSGGAAAGDGDAAAGDDGAAAGGAAPFADWDEIPAADRPWVKAAVDAGLISGYPVPAGRAGGGEARVFRPRNKISRIELGTVFGRALVKLGFSLEDRYWYLFEDRQAIPAWAREAAAAVQAEVIMGRPGYKLARFAPDARTTRGEAAAMINRFINVRARLLPEAGPAPRPAAKPNVIVSGYYYLGDARSLKSVQNHGRQLNMAFYFSYQVDAAGNLSGMPRQRDLDALRQAGVPVLAVVKNFDTKQITALLADGKAVDRAVQNILNLMDQGYAGVNLDFEGVAPADRDGYTAFVTRVASALGRRKLLATVALPARTARTAVSSWGRAYDYKGIGEVVDYVVIMSYDQHYKGSDPGPIGGADWVDEVMAYAASQIKPEKLLMGIPSYAYDWPLRGAADRAGQDSGRLPAANGLPAEGALASAGPAKARPIYEWEDNPDFYSVEELLAKHGLRPQPDPVTGESAFRYIDDQGTPRVVYFTDTQGLRRKLALVQKYRLGGVAMWRLGFEPPGYWEAYAALASGVSFVSAGGGAPAFGAGGTGGEPARQ